MPIRDKAELGHMCVGISSGEELFKAVTATSKLVPLASCSHVQHSTSNVSGPVSWRQNCLLPAAVCKNCEWHLVCISLFY